MDNFLIILVGIFLITGLIGCLISKLPGIPISYLGIMTLHYSSIAEFSPHFLIRWGVIIIAIQGLDYLIPSWGKRKFGGSKISIWGSLLGTLAGMYFGAWGIIVGAITGALAGQLLAGKESNRAIRESVSSFTFFIFGNISRFAVAGILFYHYVDSLTYVI
ncbi:MAG TPA: DUF456 domain-containing protein [Paludibacter sp.]|nr:DUF456 domain-containing protein [Paludibacter sp.]